MMAKIILYCFVLLSLLIVNTEAPIEVAAEPIDKIVDTTGAGRKQGIDPIGKEP